MANYKIEKTIMLKGERGEKGDTEDGDVTAPLNAIIMVVDNAEIPAGYELYEEGANKE